MASLRKRGRIFYAQYYVGTRQKRVSLETESLQVAKEKIRRMESALAQGYENPLPTRTALAEIVARYVEHIRTIKTAKSAQTDVYYLRQVFGPICQALQINSRRRTVRAMKRPPKEGQDRRYRAAAVEAACLEQVTTAQLADFIAGQVRSRGLAPKTANRYREILHRLFAWATAQGGVKMPGDTNPAARVERYKEKAPEIRFLTLQQIQEQLDALADLPSDEDGQPDPIPHRRQLRAMLAVLIYAGLRREELLWLTLEDIDLATGPHGTIRVRAKTIAGETWQPKTASNRAVPISRTLRGYLDNYAPRPSIGGWFFPSPQGRHYDPDNFSADLRAAQAVAKLPWTCLDFRHTFGSQLAMKGESLYKISRLMGNSPDICRRHYAQLAPESLTDSVEFRQVDKPRQVAQPTCLPL